MRLNGEDKMKRDLISGIYADPSSFDGKKVAVGGWARSIRDSKAFGFIDLNDGSCFKGVQIVFEREKIENYDQIAKLNVGSSVVVTGTVILTPENKQPFEIKAEKIDVEGESTSDYPLQKKRHTVEYLREQAYLRPRTNLFSAVFRVRSEIAFAIHQFFNSRGFVYVHTPLITGSDCEGAGEMFRVTTLDPNNLPKTRTARLTGLRISLANQPTSPFRDSLRAKHTPWLSATFIPSARPSAPKTPTPPVTPPSFG